MSYKNIGYHTRLRNDNTVKIVGGSFGGFIDMETVNRLVNSQFEVIVKPSGTPVFVDKSGREVSLYLSIDAGNTEKGTVAMRAYRHQMALNEKEQEAEQTEIDNILSELSNEEILRRLKA